MPKDREAAEILKRAQKLLKDEEIGGLTVRKSGQIEQPIPVLGLDKDLHSWFVPVTVGDVIAGFFEFQTDLTFIRYSSFQRRENSLEGCPLAKSWIDSGSIRRRIENHARANESVRELFLTFDRVPSRLAWVAVLESQDGTARILHVAGDTIWEAAGPRGSERSFEGKSYE